MNAGAIINKNKRYSLWRIWNQNLPKVLYVMLNPSLACDSEDDRTIGRLNYFTKKFGFGGFYVGNIYPQITPYPKVLYSLTRQTRLKYQWKWFYIHEVMKFARIKKSQKMLKR